MRPGKIGRLFWIVLDVVQAGGTSRKMPDQFVVTMNRGHRSGLCIFAKQVNASEREREAGVFYAVIRKIEKRMTLHPLRNFESHQLKNRGRQGRAVLSLDPR